MVADKTDRRVRRTKNLLRSALISLILERGYESVTVQHIIDRADVGRSTFYAHFRDKEDLLFYGLEELRAEPHSGHPHADATTLDIFEHFDRSRELWKAMAGRRGAEAFHRHLHRFLSERMHVQLRARVESEPTEVPLDALVEFAVSTLIGLGVRWWIGNDLQHTPQEMDRLYRQLTEPAIRAGLRPKQPING